MPINKQHKEFYAVDMGGEWEVPEGYPEGIKQKILVGTLMRLRTYTTFKLCFLNNRCLLTHKWRVRKRLRYSKVDLHCASIGRFDRCNVVIVIGLRTTRIGVSTVIIRERDICRSQWRSIRPLDTFGNFPGIVIILKLFPD